MAVTLPGCGKEGGPAGKSPATNAPAQTGILSTKPPLERILAAWQLGDTTKAIQQFLEADLKSRPVFSSGSPLSLRESDLPGMSQTEREKLLAEVHAQVNDLKQLAAAMRDKGQAAARSDPALARRCFTKLDELSAALGQPEGLKIVQLLGQAIRKMPAAESAKLTATNK